MSSLDLSPSSDRRAFLQMDHWLFQSEQPAQGGANELRIQYRKFDPLTLTGNGVAGAGILYRNRRMGKAGNTCGDRVDLA